MCVQVTTDASVRHEGSSRQGVADALQVNGPAEQVARFGLPGPSGVAIGLDGVGEVADLVRQADLVGLGIDLKLRAPQVRAPALGPRVAVVAVAVAVVGFFVWVATNGAPSVSALGIAGRAMLGTAVGFVSGYGLALHHHIRDN
jgi:uncharacterized membrane protein